MNGPITWYCTTCGGRVISWMAPRRMCGATTFCGDTWKQMDPQPDLPANYDGRAVWPLGPGYEQRRQPKISDKQKQIRNLIRRDGEHCHYCKRDRRTYKGPWTRDHVIPVSRDGGGGLYNQVLACIECNQDKGDKLLTEWTERWYLRVPVAGTPPPGDSPGDALPTP